MSISPISAASASAPPQTNWQNVLNSMSQTLGLSTSTLRQQLASGQSLSSIAQSQGVSRQALISSISSALTQNGAPTNSAQLTRLATNIADRTAGSGHHHHSSDGSGGTGIDILA